MVFADPAQPAVDLPPSRLWEALFASFLEDSDPAFSSRDIWKRATDAVHDGATMHTNGTICVHTVQQLRTLCANDTVTCRMEHEHGLFGATHGEDAFDTLPSLLAVCHILAGLVVCWHAYKWVAHPYVVIPLIQRVLRSRAWYAEAIRRPLLWLVTGAAPTAPDNHHHHHHHHHHHGDHKPFIDDDNDDDDDVFSGGTTTTTDRLDADADADVDAEPDDTDDDRALFVVTLDSVHPAIPSRSLMGLLERVMSVPAPVDVTKGYTHLDDVPDHENNAYQTSYRNADLPGHMGADTLPAPCDLPAWASQSNSNPAPSVAQLMCAFQRPFMSSQVIARDLELLWPKRVAAYDTAIADPFPEAYTSALDHAPLSSRAMVGYVLHNPVMEKRWYRHAMKDQYPTSLFEEMLRVHSSRYRGTVSTEIKEFLVGGHIAVLIADPTAPANDAYETFMRKQWAHEAGKQTNRLYLTFTPSPEGLGDWDRLARELALYIDKYIYGTLRHNM